MDIFWILLTKQAERDLKKVPLHIAEKFQLWVDIVEMEGLREARRIPSFHDEPLRGRRKGQRSIRLNRAYRAIYVERSRDNLELLEVQEINKHDY